MAAPFLLLALWPRARAVLPKPGAWMLSFRLILAFPMFATAIWLLWVLGKQRGTDAMALGLLAIVGLALPLQAWPRVVSSVRFVRAGWVPDQTPVKLTIHIAPDLYQALADYAALYAAAYGHEETPAALIPAIVATFL